MIIGRGLSPIFFSIILLVIFNWRSSCTVTVTIAVVPSAFGSWASSPIRGPASPLPITVISVPVPVPIVSLRSSTWTARPFAITARAMRRRWWWSTPVITPNGGRWILGPLKMFSLSRIRYYRFDLLPEYSNGILQSIFHA